MRINKPPVAQTGLLIRVPVAEVFEAFVDPATTTQFWFDRGSGRLDENTDVQWFWDKYELVVDVRVTAIETNRRIRIEWQSNPEDASTVEWTFESRSPDATFVTVVNDGFPGDGDAQLARAIDSTSGFALVLAGAKAYLEHGILLNVVEDSH